jgi:hypothetical protein
MHGTRDSGEHALQDGTVTEGQPVERPIPARCGPAHARRAQPGGLLATAAYRLASVGRLALIPASAATGVALTWAAFRMSVRGQSYTAAMGVFLVGMLLIFAPAVVRAVMRSTPGRSGSLPSSPSAPPCT